MEWRPGWHGAREAEGVELAALLSARDVPIDRLAEIIALFAPRDGGCALHGQAERRRLAGPFASSKSQS